MEKDEDKACLDDSLPPIYGSLGEEEVEKSCLKIASESSLQQVEVRKVSPYFMNGCKASKLKAKRIKVSPYFKKAITPDNGYCDYHKFDEAYERKSCWAWVSLVWRIAQNPKAPKKKKKKKS
ncbi:hypothetical protein Pint_16803 [Pistacia integerrima]|uniref:Uncharacterized protein n=1 Tax=Pistacia integerrima TaxID=434235 RepID=A0ACC0ZB59_9ROSI|nr:hypothetical protein Pint_16803 [Pistacia integerrima]